LLLPHPARASVTARRGRRMRRFIVPSLCVGLPQHD
jgi:hypothetical protein